MYNLVGRALLCVCACVLAIAVGELRSGFVGVVFEIWWTVHRERCEAAAAEFGDSHTAAHGLETEI